MSQFRIEALDAAQPSDWLAAVGLCRLLSGSTLRFDPDSTPVLQAREDLSAAATTIQRELHTLTHPNSLPWARQQDEASPNRSWTLLNLLAERSWTEPATDLLLHANSLGRRNGSEFKAPSGSLILIGSRMHLRSTLANLWEGADPGRPDDFFDCDIRALLSGQSPAARRAKGFFLTRTELSPQTRGGSDEAWVVPLLELIGLIGICCLLPEQHNHPEPGTAKGLTWVLNPLPMTLETITHLHELATSPVGWPRFTMQALPVPGSKYFSYFANTHPVESR